MLVVFIYILILILGMDCFLGVYRLLLLYFYVLVFIVRWIFFFLDV